MHRAPRWAVAALLIIPAFGVGLAVSATASSVSHSIAGCYEIKAPHTLEHATSTKCPSGYHSIAWNSVGPQGLPGPVGPSNAYETQAKASVPLTANDPTSILQLSVPSGTYVYSASVTFSNAASQDSIVWCYVTDASGQSPDATTEIAPSESYGDVAVDFAGTSTGTVTLTCASYEAPTVYNALLTATRVGSLTTS